MTEPHSDLHELWRGQPREHATLSLNDVRSTAEQFERKVDRGNRLTGCVIVLALIVEIVQIVYERNALERVGDALTVAAFLYLVYLFRGQVTARTMPGNLGLTASIDFYRRELARQHDAAAHPWAYLAALIPGVGLSLLGRLMTRSAIQNVAIALVAVALFVTVAWIHQRTARRLQREIDELDLGSR